MKKYLISLDKDVQRRELFFSQENTQDFTVFGAINTMQKTDENLTALFDAQAFAQRYGRNVTKGEIGCTLSHLAVYGLIAADSAVDHDEYCLICEDDALFNNNFAQNLNAVIRQNIGADIILIGQSKIPSFNDEELEINYPTTFSYWRKPIKNTGFTYSYPYKNYFAGTVAYLIKKSAVNKFLSRLNNETLPFWLADDYILFGDHFGVDTVVIRPLLVIENPDLVSNLEELRGSLKNNLLKKLLKYPLKKLMALKRNL